MNLPRMECINKDIFGLLYNGFLVTRDIKLLRLCSHSINNIISPIYFNNIILDANKIKNKRKFRYFVHKYKLFVNIKNVTTISQLLYFYTINVKSIRFSNDFNELNMGICREYLLPPTLQHLIFESTFNRKLETNELPEGLQSIVFGLDYNQCIDKALLKLKSLTLGYYFKKYNESIFSEKLKYIKFGNRTQLNYEQTTIYNKYFCQSIVDDIIFLSKARLSKIIDYMIRFGMKQTSFIGAKYKNKIYKELLNMWYGGDENKDILEQNKTKVCTGYMDCNMKCKKKYVNPIKLLWKFIDDDAKNLNYNCEVGEYDSIFSDGDKMYDYLINIFTNPNIGERIFFNGILELHNNCGFNIDHRGSDHCELELTFESHVRLNNPTFNEFICALYTIKSHKFNKWYELYCRCKIIKISGGFRILMDFDHGS
jgi:hypothetical protein